ncbi:MAG: A/G-specific adenine glycosylase [Patescibacteria group bacterium]
MTLPTFKKTVWLYYRKNSRNLPWRKTTDPYKILVSEIMLQQTQVDRVVPKYLEFVKKFPNFKSLAEASVSDVLKTWQGLGYNRRALFVKRAAESIAEHFNGKLPRTLTELESLPGIGKATAAAILAYAHNKPVTFIETNVRTVFLHHFFKGGEKIPDTEILKLALATLDTGKPRDWHYALMDYGTYLKKEFGNPNSQSKHYAKQSKFRGSDREIRGAVLKFLTCNKKISRQKFLKMSGFENARATTIIKNLTTEGFIKNNRDMLTLA